MKKIISTLLTFIMATSLAFAGDDRIAVYSKSTGRYRYLQDPGYANYVIKTDGAGNVSWGAQTGGGGGGSLATVEVDDVTVLSSATGLDFSTGFDITESPAGEANISFDFTEFNALTFGDSSLSTFVWTWALSGATDPTATFANNLITFNTPIVAGGSTSRITGSNSAYVDFATASTLIFGGVDYMRLTSLASPAQVTNANTAWDSDDFRLFIADGTRAVSVGNKTKTRSFVIPSPTASSDFPFWQSKYAITITAVSAICLNGTNVVGQLQEYNGTAGSAVDVDSDWTITTSEYTDTSFSNAAIDAGDWIGWKTTSVSGTVDYLIVTFEYYET